MPTDLQKQTLISGIVQVAIGVLSLALGIAELASTSRITLSSISGIALWAGIWILVTGILGIRTIRGRNCGSCGSLRCMAAVYMGFTITTIVFACMMIILYSITLAWYGYAIDRKEFVTIVLLILLLSIIELGVAIWACICTCVLVRCCSTGPQAPAGQVMYVQSQGAAPVAYVIVQGPDGTPVAVPAQSGGPMMVPGGTPIYGQGGGAVGTSVPAHYQMPMQQTTPQDEVKVGL